MGLRRIAYTIEESALLTIDGKTLLAHDGLVGAPRWKLDFGKPLLGVLFAPPAALPREAGAAGPWRSAATTSQAIAFDEDTMHVVDARVGSVLAAVPLGSAASAAAVGPDGLAVGVGAVVWLWHEGERHELAYRAQALAFSSDGKTLAIGLSNGDIVLVDTKLRTVKNTQGCTVAPIHDLAPAQGGSFIATGVRGMAHVQTTETSKYLNGGINGAALNRAGDVLAIHRSAASVVLYGWPPSTPLARITTTTRSIDDIAFGTDDRLAISLGQGDANIVDPASLALERTETHDGRKRHDWVITVESERDRAARAARENVSYGPASTGGGKWKVGGLVSLALIMLRLILALGRTSSYSTPTWTPPPDFTKTLSGLECNHDCEHERLVTLKNECERPTAGIACKEDSATALAAFDENRCSDTKAALTRISTTIGGGHGADPMINASRLLAELGLSDACGGMPISLAAGRPLDLVRFEGPSLTPTVDGAIPFGERDSIAMWAAPDGTLFVARRPRDPVGAPCMVYRYASDGAIAEGGFQSPHRCTTLQLFGRSDKEVYAAFDSVIYAWNGKEWKESVDFGPDREVEDLVGTRTEIMARIANDGGNTSLRRKVGSDWRPVAAKPMIYGVFGGSSIWMLAEDGDATVLEKWSNGGWSTPKHVEHYAHVYPSPNGGALFATQFDALARSVDDGKTWQADTVDGNDAYNVVFVRSASDAYAAGTKSLVHFDGKSWKDTGVTRSIVHLSGNATTLFALSLREHL